MDLLVFDYSMDTNSSVIMSKAKKGEEQLALNFADLQADAGDSTFSINWWDFKHNDVYLMARRKDPTN